jgi:hypothetical protein
MPTEHSSRYSGDPQLQRAYQRGKRAAEERRPVPRGILEGARDVHHAWLAGYADGVRLSP